MFVTNDAASAGGTAAPEISPQQVANAARAHLATNASLRGSNSGVRNLTFVSRNRSAWN
jgi:hypothetical protein